MCLSSARESPLSRAVARVEASRGGREQSTKPHADARAAKAVVVSCATTVAVTGTGRAEVQLECPACGGDIRPIAFTRLYECETGLGLSGLGNLRLLRTSGRRVRADPEESEVFQRTARAAAFLISPRPASQLGRGLSRDYAIVTGRRRMLDRLRRPYGPDRSRDQTHGRLVSDPWR